MKCRDNSIQQRFDDGSQILKRGGRVEDDSHLKCPCDFRNDVCVGFGCRPPHLVWFSGGRKPIKSERKRAIRACWEFCRYDFQMVLLAMAELLSAFGQQRRNMKPFEANTFIGEVAECRRSDVVEQDIFHVTETLDSRAIHAAEDVTAFGNNIPNLMTQQVSRFEHVARGLERQARVAPETHTVHIGFKMVRDFCVHHSNIAPKKKMKIQPSELIAHMRCAREVAV